jgi:hypothetical protein
MHALASTRWSTLFFKIYNTSQGQQPSRLSDFALYFVQASVLIDRSTDYYHPVKLRSTSLSTSAIGVSALAERDRARGNGESGGRRALIEQDV